MSKIRYLALAGFVVLMGATVSQAQSAGAIQKNSRISTLQRQIETYETQIDYLEDSRANAIKELASLKNVYEELQKEQDEQGISGESFGEIVKILQSQRVELMIELAGMEARRAAIFELKKEFEKESSDVIDQLSELLTVEQAQLDRVKMLVERGTASRSEYQKAQSRMLEVKIRLAEAKRPSKSSTVLNDELLNASLNRAEKKARLEKTETLLTTFTSARKKLEKADSTRARINNSTKKIDRSENQLQVLNTQLDDLKGQLERLQFKPKADDRSDNLEQ